MRRALVCLLATLLLTSGRAQQPLASADTSQLLTQAEAQAAAGHKNILVLFTASWCGPCFMLKGFLADKKVAPVLDQDLITVYLSVGERKDDSRHANTPGAQKFMDSLGGDKAGVPFFAILDPTGKPVIDSLRPDDGKKTNIGYPQTAAQLDWFFRMIQTACPNLSKKQFGIVRDGILDQSHRPPSGKSVEYAAPQ